MEENKVMDTMENTEITTEVEITDLTPAEEQTVETGDSMIKGALLGAAAVGAGIGIYKGVKFVGTKVKAALAKRKAAKSQDDDFEDFDDAEFVEVPEAEVNPVDEESAKG